MDPMVNVSVLLEENDEQTFWQREAFDAIFKYLGPIVLAVGTFGNVVSFCVMNTSSFRGTSHGLLLALLAFVDFGVLYTGLIRHVIKQWMKYDIRVYSRGICKTHYFFTYLFQNLSSWTLVLVTLDRLVSLWLPFRVKALCSVSRVTIVWMIMALFLSFANIHWMVLTDLTANGNVTVPLCRYSREKLFVKEIGYWVDFCLLNLIPLLIILPSNVFIVVTVYRMGQRRQVDLGVLSNRTLRSVSIMVLAVTFVFVLITLPIVLFFLHYESLPDQRKAKLARSYLAYAVCNMLYYMNSAINFFLYCLSGRHFRQALKVCSLSIVLRRRRSRTMSLRTPEIGPPRTPENNNMIELI